ncbi:unnamed protein product [Lupinus luteus]|uniref:Uncharacterized protein n=1 Tax=Lupinus luteus TaxID=3873 RepID=A0AAV1WYM2_LUPLU
MDDWRKFKEARLLDDAIMKREDHESALDEVLRLQTGAREGINKGNICTANIM